MNIAIIIPDLSGGGAERIAAQISDSFCDNGNDVYVFLLKAGAICEYKTKAKIIRLNLVFNGYDEKGEIRELRREAVFLRKYKEEFSIDVSISFMEWANALNVFSKCGDKVILSVRTLLSARGYTSIHCGKTFIRRYYNKAFRIVAVSKAVRKDLIDYYQLAPKKVVVIFNPAIKRSSSEVKRDWIYGKYALACIGRFEAVKQQDRIIRAFSFVYEKDKKARLLLIGKGYTEDYLKWIRKKYHLEEAVDFIPFTDVSFYLDHVRALVMASKAEGFPNVMVEAMAKGVPIISTDSPGGCGEIIGKQEPEPVVNAKMCEYGILTPYMCGKAPNTLALEDHEIELGKAMLKILQDDEMCNEYAKRSLKRAKDYDFDTIMSVWNHSVVGG